MTTWLDVVLSVVALVLSYGFQRYRKKAQRVLKLIEDVEKAMDDGKLTEEELKRVITDVKEVLSKV